MRNNRFRSALYRSFIPFVNELIDIEEPCGEMGHFIDGIDSCVSFNYLIKSITGSCIICVVYHNIISTITSGKNPMASVVYIGDDYVSGMR